ncbi:MAG: MCE family protein [Streptosporangiales bacterium]|nr:MCE family protein [Streptosporangiales bacterium]
MVTRLRYQVYGVAFIVVVALLVSLSVMAYRKAFSSVVMVTVDAQTVGTQLDVGGDVKVRGVLVGEIRQITSNGSHARIHLALDPAQAKHIAESTTARFVPKTLFGERYVELESTTDPGGPHIESGDVVPEDRSAAAVAVNRVLDDLLPVLRTLRPAQLSATLTAMAQALSGRGARLGENLARLDAYLARLNPHLPALRHDVKAMAAVADQYRQVVPDLAATLRNVSTTAATVTAKQDTLRAFLASTAAFADTATGFLSADEARLIAVGQVNRPTLALLARYAPEYPCLLAGLAKSDKAIGKTFAHNRLHITMEVIKARPPYQPGVDAPQWTDKRGPGCYGLPNPKIPYPGNRFDDGTQDDAYNNSGSGRALSKALLDPSAKVTGTAAEKHAVGALVGPVMGERASDVPDVATLLFGPMARGTEVSVSP